MDYMTLKEAAEKWGVTPRRVNYYCAGGRIPGAVKMAGIWLLPKTSEKPLDGRTKQGKELKNAKDTLISGLIVYENKIGLSCMRALYSNGKQTACLPPVIS